ncbi:carboxypeptidase-like regulatory domain-containing protein [Siccationidurans ginsengisoli]|uniref:carboxypeptidase-like regulatory domain-containing protein n=1 Tax=Hymenobacter TaxID=89966 RepID=UPI001AADBC6D|nr:MULTISPECIES: carboxypeptidase-like regulatory domain-containing protein [unclassified Hymenobacter]MBO2030268.1 carboxypeptidase-like regulatory domain-containing protein [Hymenobacter sp. BT559]
MLRFSFLAFFWLLTTAALAQAISGRMTDARTGQPLPFVNIGVVGKALGTVSNEQGQYGLAFREPLAADTVRVSYLGYQPRLLTLRQLQGQPNLALSPAAVALAEVRVQAISRAWRDRQLGFSGNSENSTLSLEPKDLGAETGTVIYLKRKPTNVLKANFNVAYNHVGNVTLRVNLYRLDAKGRPTNDKLLHREVILRTAAAHGPISVDLTPDNLLLSEDFFLSLEWVGGAGADAAALQKGLAFSAGIGYADNDIYYRVTSQASWERISAGAVLAGMQPKLSFYVSAQD